MIRFLFLVFFIALPAAADITTGGNRSGGHHGVTLVNPPTDYVWNYGDIADIQASRLNVIWDNGAWADPYDTEAELLAAGWTSHPVNATSCSDTTDDADEVALRNGIDAICDPGNTGNVDCGNKIIRLQGSCHYDMTAGAGNSDSPPALDLPYSNVAYVGSGPNSTYIDCNDTGTATSASPACVGHTNYSDPLYGVVTLGTFGWTAGNTTGTTVITVSGTCANLTTNDRIVLRGVSADGLTLSQFNEVASADGCNITLREPIRYDIPTRTEVAEVTPARLRNVFFIGMTISFPQFPDGTQTEFTEYSGGVVQYNQISGIGLSNVRIGPYSQFALSLNGQFRVTLRNSEIGPCQMCKRRGNNGGVLILGRANESGPISVFNNVFTDGAKRFMAINQMSSLGSWYGFNYMTDMLATNPSETGNHFEGVGNPQGIPMCSGCGSAVSDERTIFWGHDTNSYAKQGTLLIEANDLGGKTNGDSATGDHNRYTTLFRNRWTRYTLGQGLAFNDGFVLNHMNWIANRVHLLPADNNSTPNVIGRWNVGLTSIGPLTATGASWPTTGLYKNYIDSGPHDDYPVNLPPSLALQSDTPPDWWCQESGPWDGTWTFAYADGADNGGVPRKLPAQIRYENGTCTPPVVP